MKNQNIAFLLMAGLFALSCKTELDFGDPPRPDYDPLRDANIKPLVIATYPLDNSQGPYENFGTVMQLRFNKIMNETSVRRAVHIASLLGDVAVDTNTLSTVDGVVFFIEAIRANSPARFWWKVGQPYTLTVDSLAFDINNNRLQQCFSMTFQPEPYFRLLSTDPPNGSSAVPLDASSGFIRLEFNSDVDSTMTAMVHLSPLVSGKWHLEDPTHMYFQLFQPFELSKSYTLTIDTSARDVFGHSLTKPETLSFTSEPFRVMETFPQHDDRLVQPTSSIAVRFNVPIDTGSVRSAFTSLPKLTGIFEFEERQFYFVPSLDSLRTNTRYTILLRQSLRSIDSHSLTSDYHFTFDTDRFRVVNYDPAHQSSSISRMPYIYVQCNARILYSSLSDAFSVYPPVLGTIDTCPGGNYSGFEFCFVPSDTLSPYTFYQIAAGWFSRDRGSHPLRSRTGAGTFTQWYFQTGDK